MAAPSAVAKSTVTVELGGADKLTVKVAFVVPLLPSTPVTSLIDKVGNVGGAASSSTIVPTPCPSAMVAADGLLRLTKKFCGTDDFVKVNFTVYNKRQIN